MSQQQRGINAIDTIRNFLWPIGIFRDASKGNQFERAAAYRHNREARTSLPHYMRNSLLVAIVLASAGAYLEDAHNLAAAILCWIFLTFTVSGLAVLSAIYLVLTVRES
jgi:hypothetical protein